MTTKKYILSIILLLLGSHLTAQEKPRIEIIGRATKDSVMLRWAPASPAVWELANKYGYMINRITILRDGKILKTPERITLSQEVIKPRPLSEWEALADRDDYAAVAAEAIFGETFELSPNYQGDILQVINKAKELENRFSFALFSADQSVEAARFCGLYYADKTAKKNEKYVYEVYTLIPAEIVSVDTGSVYVGIQDYGVLPKPIEFYGEFGDGVVVLSWDQFYLTEFYNSYFLERSTDGVNFTPISDKPYINTSTEEEPRSRRMFKVDSLANSQKVFYRLRGKTAFGEFGPYSKVISGIGAPRIGIAPQWTKVGQLPEGPIELEWSFPDSLNYLVQGFFIQRANKEEGPYKRLQDGLISKNTRASVDESPTFANYYQVGLEDLNGNTLLSFPYFLQTEDSIPPVAPTGLEAKVDTTGIVRLSWNTNNENDLVGYRVFRSNFKSEEFYPITREAISDTVYVDTIPLKNLTSKIYYKVKAVDLVFNSSEFSELLELTKPDIVPPVPPVFRSYSNREDGVLLEWTSSSSSDVLRELLYRRKSGDQQWSLAAMVNIDDSAAFLDKDVELGESYQYLLLAVDDNGLESEPSQVLTLKRIKQTFLQPVENIFTKVDREARKILVQWDYPLEQANEFKVYRRQTSQTDTIPTLQKTLGIETMQFEDENLTLNEDYEYFIQVVGRKGNLSRLSKPVKVTY